MQTEEQKLQADAQAITSQSLAPVEAVTIPPPPPIVDPRVASQTSLDALISSTQAPSPEETAQGDLSSQILKSLELTGTEATRKAELEKQAGLPEQRKALQESINQIQALQKEALAIPISIQEEFTGRGVTAGGVEPIQTSRLRQNAIRALGIAAIAQTQQGNLQLAQSAITSALEAEFEPQRTRLQYLTQLYQFNKDALERSDKKRSNQLSILLNERERVLNLQEADKKEIYNLGTLATKYNAPSSKVQEALRSGTKEEALSILSPYLQDPQARIELENARLDTLIKSQQLRRITLENSLIGQPTQMDIKRQRELMVNAESSAQQAKEQIGEINSLKTHSGFDSRVGTGMFNRAPQGFWDGVGRIAKSIGTGAVSGAVVGAPFGGVGAIPGAVVGALSGLGIGTVSSLQGLPDAWSGAGQNFAGSVHLLTENLTLEKLQQAKANGATFGALSDSELLLLSKAATKIKDWEIKDDKNIGTGFWNIDEDSFNVELERIKSLTQKALQDSGQSGLSSDVESVLQGLEETNNELIPGINYY